MNIVKNIEQYDENNVYFFEPIKNNIMNEGTFIRILYSTENFMLNGIYLHITLNDIFCEKYYNKYRCMFNTVTHKEIIDSLKIIEESLLKKLEIKNKVPQFKINEQLKNGNAIWPDRETARDQRIIRKRFHCYGTRHWRTGRT